MEPNPLALFGLCLAGAGALVFLFWLNHQIRTRPQSVKRYQDSAPIVMSRAENDAPLKTDMEAVYIPVRHTGMSEHTTPKTDDITDDYEMPRVGRRLSDDEIITVLATQKGADGAKYRFSANEIAQIMKGDRNTRLDQIRAIREGPPAPQVREHQARLEQIRASRSAS